MDIHGIVIGRIKLTGNQSVEIFPNSIVTRTIGIVELEQHRSGTVQIHMCDTVHAGIIGRLNLIAAHIMHRRRNRASHICKTRLGSASVSRERIKLGRQLNVVGKLPNLRMTSAIGIWIVEDQVAFATVIASAVDSKRTRREHFLASVFHRRQRDGSCLGLGHAVHRGILGCRQGEVVR